MFTYRIEQPYVDFFFLFSFCFAGGWITTLMAASKTALTFCRWRGFDRCLKEHVDNKLEKINEITWVNKYCMMNFSSLSQRIYNRKF